MQRLILIGTKEVRNKCMDRLKSLKIVPDEVPVNTIIHIDQTSYSLDFNEILWKLNEIIEKAGRKVKTIKLAYLKPMHSGQPAAHALALKRSDLKNIQVFAIDIPDGNGKKSKGMKYVTEIGCISEIFAKNAILN